MITRCCKWNFFNIHCEHIAGTGSAVSKAGRASMSFWTELKSPSMSQNPEKVFNTSLCVCVCVRSIHEC